MRDTIRVPPRRKCGAALTAAAHPPVSDAEKTRRFVHPSRTHTDMRQVFLHKRKSGRFRRIFPSCPQIAPRIVFTRSVRAFHADGACRFVSKPASVHFRLRLPSLTEPPGVRRSYTARRPDPSAEILLQRFEFVRKRLGQLVAEFRIEALDVRRVLFPECLVHGEQICDICRGHIESA